jgi:hypothetical protein
LLIFWPVPAFIGVLGLARAVMSAFPGVK